MYDVKQIEKRINTNPNIQKLVKDKNIKDQTFLSPYTIVENNVVRLTSDHLINKANTRIIGPAKKDGRSMNELLKNTNW